MDPKIKELRKQRALAFDAYKALAEKADLTADEKRDYPVKKKAVEDFDDQIKRAKEAQELALSTAREVEGQEQRVHARPEADPYIKNRSLVIGGMMKMIGAGNGNLRLARQESIDIYGENHPVTRALITSVGASGGFIVPPDYMNEIIELLRPMAVVRGAGPRVIPMPRGTMTIPGQATPATASYGTEVQKISASQQTLRDIVASFKKLTALVPVSNDMMRYADPAVDAFVRDDLVKVIALREDLAFLTGDGTLSTPRGYLSFANGWVLQNGGTTGVWSSSANSTADVDGTPGDPLLGNNGGNFITSTLSYTLATAAAELGGLVNKLDTANVPDIKRVWFMHPRTFNYLFNVQNSLGVYVFREELITGRLLTYPFKKTTQMPISIWDSTGANKDCSFLMLAEMEETMILDSMSLELAVSREGSYIDASGNTVSAFQNDQTLIRAIAEHDFQLRHDSAVAIDQFVRWAPAIS